MHPGELTFIDLFVSFIPDPTIWPSYTRTHPTGVSFAWSAFSP